MNLLVIAKSPVSGRSKTRLSPPCSPEQAAMVAEAALADTLDAVVGTPGVSRRVLVLEGARGRWLPPGFDVISQRGDRLDERLAAAFREAGGPALLIGMDTPQVTPALLATAIGRLLAPRVEAVLGAAEDGGWWAIGLREPDDLVFLGVPMSTDRSGEAQSRRLRRLGLSFRELPVLRDVDGFDDAIAVAGEVPGSRFANAVMEVAGLLAGIDTG